MMKLKTIALAFAMAFTGAHSVAAHPVFAERHGMSCSGCHVTPIVSGAPLNSNGRSFKANGYKFDGPIDGGGGGGGNGGDDKSCITIGKLTICQ